MFETPEIRTSFVDAIVTWIESSYDIHDSIQLEEIRTSLTVLSDEKLIEAGKEVEDFEKSSKDTMGRLNRQVTSVEHSIEEEKERSEITLPLFS